MEEYNRDSLRQLRRSAEDKPSPKKGSRWVTLLIILILLAAGSFFIATQVGFTLSDARKTLVGWGEDIITVFNGDQEDDIEKTVNAVLKEQNESI